MLNINGEQVQRREIRKNMVQNVVVTHAPTTTHITPLCHELHQLPVAFQVQFKVLVLTFKSLHGMESSFLKDYRLPSYTYSSHQNWQDGHVMDPSC